MQDLGQEKDAEMLPKRMIAHRERPPMQAKDLDWAMVVLALGTKRTSRPLNLHLTSMHVFSTFSVYISTSLWSTKFPLNHL